MVIDPHVYPETNILKNLPGIKDHDQLQQFEAISTAQRILQLTLNLIQGSFDIAHFCRIHRHIFQDVYAWAGQFRSVDIRKEGQFWFCRHEFISQSLESLFDAVSNDEILTRSQPHQFGARAGYYMTELNAIHAFREGNGRAQREFIRELGLRAGLDVDWTAINTDEMYSASLSGFQKGDRQPMIDLITRITAAISHLVAGHQEAGFLCGRRNDATARLVFSRRRDAQA